jgi:glycerol-3-phosphate dehydrogenase (NAD(P)+)
MGRLGTAVGGDPATFAGLAGVGDLVATCTSDRSRNRRVGIGLGQGRSIAEAVAAVGEVAEGVGSAEPLVALATELDVELPICEQVAAIVTGSASPTDALASLMSRPAREEGDLASPRSPS